MDSLRIEILEPAAEPQYRDLVAAAPAARWTHTLSWRDALRAIGMGDPVYWIALRGDVALAALPAFVMRGPLGAVLNSLPFFQSTGGVICRGGVLAPERRELERDLLGAMLAWCRGSDVTTACVVGSAFAEYDEGALPTTPDFRVLRRIQVTDLAQPLTRGPFVRRMVRKAEALRPVLREAHSIEEVAIVYELYQASVRRNGATPYDFAVYREIFGCRSAGIHPRFLWAEVDGAPVAGTLLIEHRGIIDYFSAGATDLGRSIQASSWLCDEQLRAAAKQGAVCWNWMASPSPSVSEFKRKWGGQDRSYPIWLWRVGDLTALHGLTPGEVTARFPGYFAIPYDWLPGASPAPA